MPSTQQAFQIYRGGYRVIEFRPASATDITGQTFVFSYTFRGTTARINASIFDAAAGYIRVTFDRDATAALEEGSYDFALWRTDTAPNTDPVSIGTFGVATVPQLAA